MVLFGIGLESKDAIGALLFSTNDIIGIFIGIVCILLIMALGIYTASKQIYDVFDEMWVAILSIVLWIITTIYYIALMICNLYYYDGLIFDLLPIAMPTISLIFSLLFTIVCYKKEDELTDLTRFILIYSTAAIPLFSSFAFSLITGHSINVIESIKMIG